MMTRASIAAGLLVSALSLSAPAWAQDDEAGEQVELTDDPPLPSGETPAGAEENPGAPTTEGSPSVEAAPPPHRRTGYPIEEVLRPLTLPAVTSEVALDTRATFDPLNNGSTLRARYGITGQWQVGLHYGIGGLFDSGDGSTKFHAGKAVSIDAAYLVQDWVAATISVPMYLDPFAAGVVLSAPMKFHFGERFAIFGLEDAVEIKISKFSPSLTDELTNQLLADDTISNTTRPDGTLRLQGGAIYQIDPDLAVSGRLGYTFVDFDSKDAIVPLLVTVQKTMSGHLDVAGRIGFENLDEASKSFGIQLTAAFRI